MATTQKRTPLRQWNDARDVFGNKDKQAADVLQSEDETVSPC